MSLKIKNADKLGFSLSKFKEGPYQYGNLDCFPVYFGTHPKVMEEKVRNHFLSRKDWEQIKRKYFWSPFLWFRIRYKTFKRINRPIV